MAVQETVGSVSVSRVEEATPPGQVATARALPRFEQFYAVRRFQPTLTFTPDGREILFSTDISGQFNVWRSSVEGGRIDQLTAFDENAVREITVSPDGESVVFTADHHGDEFHQIYSRPARGGWPEPLTDAPQVQHFVSQGNWSPDGSRFAFAANAETPTDMDVWLHDLGTGEVRRLFGGGMYAVPVSWSPDGRHLLALDVRSNTDMTVYLVDAESGEGRELTPREEEARYLPGPWAADGSGFYILSDEGREYVGLAFFRLDAGELEWVETPDADVEDIAGSRDGRVLAWLVNERGWSRLYLRDLQSGALLPTPELPAGCGDRMGSALTVSRDGRFAALLWAQPRRPGELYVIDTATGRTTRISESMLGGLSIDDLVAPEEITYESFDGRQIPAWLYRPPHGDGELPVVLSIHGGPESQERPGYAPLYQYLLSRGIAVLATNIRGSTGYGKTYQKLIHRDWGGADLEDWRHAAEWLRLQDWVDSDRIAVYGGSYGGFATLTCVTRLPDYWAAAVDIVGPSNLVTFARAVPPTWRRYMTEWVGDPETEQDFLLERSPITYVENVRAPLLVLQGAQDPRVVKPESDQMVERLRELDRDVEYVVFDDEGHGFTKRSNQLRAARLTAGWLERHLVGSNS